MKAKLTYYYYDLKNPADATAYSAMCERLTSAHYKCFNVYREPRKIDDASICDNKTIDIILDTKYIFDDQWNAEGIAARLFDWYEVIYPNAILKVGHYIHITDEIRALRANTLSCGYCGKQYARATCSNIFCTSCLDSSYLSQDDLYMLRLKPVSDSRDRAKLSEAESLELMPRYVVAQTSAKAKAAKARLGIEKEYNKAIATAETKHKGFLWMLDHGINIDNCIYYSHLDIFSFGWRSELSVEVITELKLALDGFPYKYEFKNR